MNIENQVVSLDLAKELKANGYEQEGVWWWANYKGWEIWSNSYAQGPGKHELSKSVAPTVAELISLIEKSANEWACGYNDSGCFYHFRKGNRGTGNMIEGFGRKSLFNSEQELFVNALAEWWLYLKKNNLLT